jgi:hypothetical protein
VKKYFQKLTSAAPLATFRIGIGLMITLSITRFWMNGWIDQLYIEPQYFFPFYGFEFVKPLGDYTYILFLICGISAFFVAIGLFYRIASVLLFLSFTYIELIDKSTYLNHYYFISLILLLMMFLPANRYFSVDAFKNKKINSDQIPQWCPDSIKLMVCLLYFFAGLAKLNSDWLIHALPLKIWLPARNDIPVIGPLFNYSAVHYFLSWAGCLYDLTIGFLLWHSSTRIWAYLTVVIFHGITALLFPIGMFPYVMIVTALIFFSGNFHKNLIKSIAKLFGIKKSFIYPRHSFSYKPATKFLLLTGFSIFFLIQVLLPFRYLLYKGELFWTEEGYRFSWRVMLIEKAGYAQFTVRDSDGKFAIINNNDFLTILQEKMMSTQPDMILQYAHILRDHYKKLGFIAPQVYVDSYVALNGRSGRIMVDPSTDLAQQEESFRPKTWILPLNDEIKGF